MMGWRRRRLLADPHAAIVLHRGGGRNAAADGRPSGIQVRQSKGSDILPPSRIPLEFPTCMWMHLFSGFMRKTGQASER